VPAVPVTTAPDLWAFGVVMHELVTGSHPFNAGSRSEEFNLFDAQVHDFWHPATPERLMAFCHGILNRFPGTRKCMGCMYHYINCGDWGADVLAMFRGPLGRRGAYPTPHHTAYRARGQSV